MRNRLISGGKLIALVGGDGAGKSTAVNGLYDWLSPNFCTTTIHLGKPSKSGCTITVAVARRVALLFGKLFDLVRPVSTTTGHQIRLRDHLLLLRSVCIARDRYRLYKRARRLATNGVLVICDRYPTPQIESMDGPNIGRLIRDRRTNRITTFLQKTEASYYRHIMAPDVMIVLKVRPDIAVQRKTDEDSDYVRARSLEVWRLDLSQTAHVLDAGRAKTDVLDDLKNVVWSEL
jgi:thymidylate kinase